MLLVFLLAACKKDTPRPKQPPAARFFVDTIALDTANRLPSRFVLRWYGDDPDGYVVGYELRANGGAWAFTTAQESTFVVPFAPGELYKDIVFELRAVDNDGLRTDPPARLRVPLRNSPPVCRLDPQVLPPDTTLPVVTLLLRVADPDGAETVESLYVRIGPASPWIAVEPRHTLLTLVPEDPKTSSATLVYSDTRLVPILRVPVPLPLNDTVRFYVRAKDQGGLFSEPDSTRPIYLRRKVGDWLVMDSWNDDGAYGALAPDMAVAWGSYDYWNLRNATQRVPLRVPTWLHIWRLYPRVCWIGNVTALPDLEASEALIESYLTGGGRLFLNFPLPSSIEARSPVFRFGPMDSIATRPQNGVLASGSPVSSQVGGFPDLSNGLPYFLSGVNPPFPKGTAQVLYTMPSLLQGNGQPWPATGSRVAAAAFPAASPGRYTQVFLILPLHQLGGDRVAFLQALQTAFQP